MSSDDVLIEVKDLKKCYEIYASPRDRLKQLVLPPIFRLFGKVVNRIFPNRQVSTCKYYREFWALDGVSFKIRRGETFGIIGKNGSGKSTLLQILAGTLTPTSGEVKVNGRVAALLELGSGFNPEFTGKENVFLNARILGLTEKEILDKYDQIIEFADIGEFIDQPVKTYSSGMFVRLAFAVQAHIDASIVIIDEALAVGDIYFRQKCYARLEQIKKSGSAILLVSHAMSEIEQFCSRALLLNKGSQEFIGDSSMASKHYYLLNQNQNQNQNIKILKKELNEPLSENNIDSNAYLNINKITQITNGKAKCVRVAITDSNGNQKNTFRQGEYAIFHYEFLIKDRIEVPICGMVITNDKGIIVHGKSNWQFSDENTVTETNTGLVTCRHLIKLNLGQGEYLCEVGIASVSKENWENRQNIPFEVESELIERICHVPNVMRFAVIIGNRNGINHLTHHGIADLESKFECTTRLHE